VHAPDQPVKAEPAAGAGVRATEVPVTKACEQVDPQEIPLGELVTLPLPAPASDTVSVLWVWTPPSLGIAIKLLLACPEPALLEAVTSQPTWWP